MAHVMKLVLLKTIRRSSLKVQDSKLRWVRFPPLRFSVIFIHEKVCLSCAGKLVLAPLPQENQQTFHYYFSTSVFTEQNCITWSALWSQNSDSSFIFPSRWVHDLSADKHSQVNPPPASFPVLFTRVKYSYSKGQVEMLILIDGTE